MLALANRKLNEKILTCKYHNLGHICALEMANNNINLSYPIITHHSISGGGFPFPSQQNVILCPGIRILLSGWTVTNGGPAKFNTNIVNL